MTRAAIALAVVVMSMEGCHRAPSSGSCADDLSGVWRDPDRRSWMIIDDGEALEVYPLFDDGKGPAEIVEAPRVLDLHRDGAPPSGSVHRLYMRGGDACTAAVPARITACTTELIDLVLSDPTPPLGFTPCTWGRPRESRREHWHRD